MAASATTCGSASSAPRRRSRPSCATSSKRFDHSIYSVCNSTQLTCSISSQANAFAPGWGQTIFQNASEVAQNQLLKQRVDELQGQTAAEKAWWEKKRGTIRADFMKELDEGSGSAQTKNSDDDAVLVETASTTSRPSTAGSVISGASSKKKGKGKK